LTYYSETLTTEAQQRQTDDSTTFQNASNSANAFYCRE